MVIFKIVTMLLAVLKIFEILLTKSASTPITKCHGLCNLNDKHLFLIVLDSKSKVTVGRLGSQ